MPFSDGAGSALRHIFRPGSSRHAVRHIRLGNCCTGLLLPTNRQSVEPMAAGLAGNHVRRMDQLLHHLVDDAPWEDEVSWNAVWIL